MGKGFELPFGNGGTVISLVMLMMLVPSGTAGLHCHSFCTVTVVLGLVAVTLLDGTNTGVSQVAGPLPMLAQYSVSDAGTAGGCSVKVQFAPSGAEKVAVPEPPPGPTLALTVTLDGMLAGLQLAFTV